MNKKQERACFEAVFARRNFRVSESEEPDFICDAENGFNFGVEVTEFFRTESDARLARIDGYALDLISGADYRHKDDRREIRVEDVTYCRHETGERIPLKAIPRDIPNHQETMPLLLKQIETKNAKFDRYRNRTATVDLIVDDVDKVLRFESIQQLLPHLLGKGEINNSPFREIYVLTLNAEQGRVAVPIRANLFACEIATFCNVYNAFLREKDRPDKVRQFLTALAGHLAQRLPALQYQGQRTLNRGAQKDFQHFFFAPSTITAVGGD